MSRFFVGQRVKLVRPLQPKHLGFTGVVIALFAEQRTIEPTYPINCDIKWDYKIADDTHTQTHTSRLEPIIPDGHRAGDFSLNELLDRCKLGEGVPA